MRSRWLDTCQQCQAEAIGHTGDVVADDPLETLRQLGGFEIAALCGVSLRCAQNRIPVLVDGFIATSAALAALGAAPICIGVVGDDADGQILTEALIRLGVDISSLHRLADRFAD